MIFHENRLPADEYYALFDFFFFGGGGGKKKRQNLKLSSAENYRWHVLGYMIITKVHEPSLITNRNSSTSSELASWLYLLVLALVFVVVKSHSLCSSFISLVSVHTVCNLKYSK